MFWIDDLGELCARVMYWI